MSTPTTIQRESNSSIFPEFDDDNPIYKNCIQCGQAQYPFKHGICRLCGDNNWTANFEIPQVQKLGIKELIDN
jgi:uncharacterized OB-fold protein